MGRGPRQKQAMRRLPFARLGLDGQTLFGCGISNTAPGWILMANELRWTPIVRQPEPSSKV